MNNIKYVTILLSLICLISLNISCKEWNNSSAIYLPVNNNDKTTIEVDINSNIIDVKDILDSIRFLSLETSKTCLIGEIDKIIYRNDNYFILDRSIIKTLYQFDNEGQFVRKFGANGRGPGEYVEPTDFLINSSNVIILDQFTHNLLFFDFNGDYSHSVPLKYKIHAITLLDNDSLIIAEAGDNRRTDVADYELLVMDTKGEIIMKGLKNPDEMNYSQTGYNLHQMNNSTIYHRSMINSIYKISDTVINERYNLQILNSPLPENFEEMCNGNFENFMKEYKGKYNYFSGQFIETEKHILFGVVNTDKLPITVIYNKNSRKLKSGILGMHSNEGEVSLNDFAFTSINQCLTVNGNEIIGYLNANLIPNKEEDNPILVFFYFKDF